MEKISLEEFYENYCLIDGKKPELRDIDREVLRKAEEGAILVVPRIGDSMTQYMLFLVGLARDLREGKRVVLVTKNEKKNIIDLKQYFGIEASVEPCKVNGVIKEHTFIVLLKSNND